MKIATWNINSVRLRAPLFAELEKQAAPDIVCLQENLLHFMVNLEQEKHLLYEF